MSHSLSSKCVIQNKSHTLFLIVSINVCPALHTLRVQIPHTVDAGGVSQAHVLELPVALPVALPVDSDRIKECLALL